MPQAHHRRIPRARLFDAQPLERRCLLASAPLLIDFGSSGPATEFTAIADRWSSSGSITTPAHEDGSTAGYRWYNQVGAANVTGGLRLGDGSDAGGVSLTWGRTVTSGGAIDFADASRLSTGATNPSTQWMEFDNELLRDAVFSSTTNNVSATREQALRVSGLPAGTYAVYLVNTTRALGKTFHNQIGVNLAAFDLEQAQFQGGIDYDGQWSPSGEYSKQLVSLNRGDTLDLIVHGNTWVDGSRTNAFNLLEIVPLDDLPSATTPVQQPQMAIHNSAAVSASVDAWGAWTGHDTVWVMDYADSTDTDWSEIENPWAAGQLAGWVNARAGRRFVLSVPMVPTGYAIPNSASDASQAHIHDAHFTKLAQNLIAKGLGDSILRVGWEFNGNWYPWAAGTSSTSQGNWVRYFRSIVNAIRSVGTAETNRLLIEWNPALGDNTTSNNLMNPTLVWPGAEYVDIIGLDVYDEYLGYSATPSRTQQEQKANTLLNQSRGLMFWAGVAKDHGKYLSIPEWGVRNTNPGGGDNAYFISMMHGFVANPDNRVLYQSYFNYRGSSTADWAIYPGTAGTSTTRFPEAAAEFLESFGNTPTALDVDRDIGEAATRGWATFNRSDNSWTIAGAGTGTASGGDSLHLAASTVAGDQSLVVRVGSISEPAHGALAGIVMRDGHEAGRSFAGVFLTPAGVQMRFRSGNGALQTVTASTSTGPVWLKLVRSGNTFVAYYANSTRHPLYTDWRVIGSARPTFSSGAFTSGLAVASGNVERLSTVRFTSFRSRPIADAPVLYSGVPEWFWTHNTVGSVPVAGAAEPVAARVLTLTGSGTIWNRADQFGFYSTGASGDVTMIARIDSITAIQNNTNTGIMFRDSLASDSRMVMFGVRQDGGLRFYSRASNGAMVSNHAVADVPTPSPTTPIWLKLVKSGATYSAYYAAGSPTAAGASTSPPSTWSLAGSASVSFDNTTFRAGIATESAGTSKLNYATFGYVDVTRVRSTPPTLVDWRINDDSAQRSTVRRISVLFDKAVALQSGAAALLHRSGTSILLEASNPSGDGRHYTFTFAGSGTSSGSLNDGDYTLTLHAAAIRNKTNQPLAGGDHVFAFHRLLGDSDGDRDVDAVDALRFKLAYQSFASGDRFNPAFDTDDDGDVDAIDALKFKLNYGKRL